MNKKILNQLGFDDEVDNIEEGKCPTCGKPISVTDFSDPEYREEFKISGMCRECQDEVFD